MSKIKSYAGIDYFRFIAALLIITIHTSPLVSFSETGDFILTRVIARVAVPFFFMTSGFFMISRYTNGQYPQIWTSWCKISLYDFNAILLFVISCPYL